jgi:citrate lyase alpha subunit
MVRGMTDRTKLGEVPQAILDVILQPIARGGSLHFAAGNIRIVKFAHDLLTSQARDEVIANHNWFAAHFQEIDGDGDNGNAIINEDWRRFMEDEHGIKEKDRGEESSEQLVVNNQTLYTCPFCQTVI